MPPVLTLVLVGVTLTSLWLRYQKYLRNPQNLPYPPGPPTKPLIGNLKDVPQGGYEWDQHEALSRRIGSAMVFLQVFGKKVLALNSFDVANELLNKRSLIYSDRPRMVQIKELIGWKWHLVFKSYDQGFGEARKLVQHELQPATVAQVYRSTMQREVKRFLRKINKQPEGFYDCIKIMAATIIMMSTYGHQCSSDKDPYIQLAEDVHRHRVKRPGSHPVDLLPFLRFIPAWFPGAQFKRDALDQRERAIRMREEPFRAVKEQMANGTAVPSLVSSLLEKHHNDPDHGPSEELIQDLGGVMYSAGADTTSSAIRNFFLAIRSAPEVQKKAQKELDEVVGRDRLPTWEDRPSLPYLECILVETLRWKSVTPLGAPHATAKDDQYQGYYIPKGTTVVSNISAMLHDEDMFPDAQSFNPDRFLNEKTPDPTKFLFGFGRRICPGRHFALDAVWLTIASVLHLYDISADSEALAEKIDWNSGLVSSPSPYTCTITPRFTEMDKLL